MRLGSPLVPGFPVLFGQMAAVVVFAALVCVISHMLVFRRFTLCERRDCTMNPLGLILQAKATLIVTTGIGYLMTQSMSSRMPVGVTMATTDHVIDLLTLPRDESQMLSREQVAENIDKTRELT